MSHRPGIENGRGGGGGGGGGVKVFWIGNMGRSS